MGVDTAFFRIFAVENKNHTLNNKSYGILNK